jgi:signal transduction histidine kinase
VCFAFATVGTLVAARIPRNAIGWLFLAIALILLATSDAQLYAIRGILVAPGSLPLTRLAGWLGSWLWGLGVGLTVVFVPLLFPDGRPPGRGWRLWARVAAVIILAQAVVAATISYPHPTSKLDTSGQFDTITTSGSLADVIFSITYTLIVPLCLVSVASLFVRRRRADAIVRQQLKFFMYAGVFVLVGVAASAVGNSLGGSGLVYDVGASILVTSVGAVPVAAGLAILRYGLYEIDVVISRTLVYGALAALITGVYVGIAVGIGELVESGGRPNLGLSILATAIVAVGFQPARERLQRIANRLVYGRRATPYQVLSEFSSNVAGSYAADEVLSRMSRVLREGTAAESATVWLRSGETLHPAAVWPPDAAGSPSLSAGYGSQPSSEAVPQRVLRNSILPSLPGVTRAVEVRHQGELLGALSVVKRRGEAVTPVEEKLLTDLAHQAGLVLKNVGLTADLQRRLEELRASRQRLVSAQDAERRRLERNLHDGAQQHLVALKVKLGLAEMLAARDPEKAKQTIAQLKADTDEALETLRDLARGIYPPLLAEKGLPTALESQARKATVPVTVDADGVGRYPQEVEATVYFCVLEALQNVQKYAKASHAVVRLRHEGGTLHFEVEDDGVGFDVEHAKRGAGVTNMTDRVDALGGTVAIRSGPGQGTCVSGTIAVRSAQVTATAGAAIAV